MTTVQGVKSSIMQPYDSNNKKSEEKNENPSFHFLFLLLELTVNYLSLPSATTQSMAAC